MSSLDGFLKQFSAGDTGKWVQTIDPLNSFDIRFEFFPTLPAISNGETEPSDEELIAAKQAQDDADEKNKKEGKPANFGVISNIGTIASSLGLKIASTQPQVIIDFTYYVQNTTIPKITLNGKNGEAETLIGRFPISGQFVQPDSTTLNLEFINTKAPLIERLFYPWMREISLPYWSYDTQPFTTANIHLSMKKHSDITYIFVNARPSDIQTMQPSQQLNSNFTRQVTFTFDYMFVTSSMKQKSSSKKNKQILDALGGGAKKLVGL